MGKKLILPHNPAYQAGHVLGYADYDGGITPRLLEYTRASGDYNDVGDYFDVDEPTITSDGYVMANIQRTNLLTRSNDFSNAVWVGGNATLTPNAGISPDGTNNATLYEATSTSDFLGQTVNVTGGQAMPYSFHVQKGTNDLISLVGTGTAFSTGAVMQFNLTTLEATVIQGNVTDGVIKNLGNGWFRISAIYTPTSTNAATFRLQNATPDSTNFLIYGAQLEVGSYPSTYIPTEASTVTRAAANAGTSFQAVDVSSGGSLVIKMKAQPYNEGGSSTPIFRVQQDGDNFLGVSVNGSFWRLRVTNGSSTSALISSPHGIDEDVNLGIAWDSTGFSFWSSGEKFYEDNVTDVTSGIVTLKDIVASQTEGRGPLAYKDLKVWDERLSEAEMAKATRL